MNLVRYNSNYDNFFPEFNRFFDNTLSKEKRKSFVPDVDVIENENSFELQISVPGMKKDDFNIEFSDNLLTISGERKFINENKEDNFYSFESQFGTFKRIFRIPKNINQEKTEAKYTDGILYLELPKSEDYKIKNTIKIK